jgi:single-strand DNA-binding protein
MNKAILIGRLTRDCEVRVNNDKTVARFSLAVDRRFKNNEGKTEADFINCVAFGKVAEFISNYFFKGMKIGVVGHIQTGSFTNNAGQKVYTTDVVVDEAEFVESKNNNAGNTTQETPKETTQTPPSTSADGFVDGFVDCPDDELPFK